jgi:hypothetical protein
LVTGRRAANEEKAMGAPSKLSQPKKRRAECVRHLGAPVAIKVILDVLEKMDTVPMG